MTSTSETVTLEATNDNPDGTTRIQVPLAAFVTILAEAYVARDNKKELSA